MTKNDGLIWIPKTRSLEVYAVSDLIRNWYKPTFTEDVCTTKLRTGYAIMYTGWQIIWSSMIKTHIALITTESEYMTLPQLFQDRIPVMWILQKIKSKVIENISNSLKVYCNFFEDNSGVLELARMPKLQLRTKYINVIYHHFRSYVRDKSIYLFTNDISNQTADILSKLLLKTNYCFTGRNF